MVRNYSGEGNSIRRRRIRSGRFQSLRQRDEPLFSTWNGRQFRAERLNVSRSFVPSTYDTTETVTTTYQLAYKIFHPHLLEGSNAPLIAIHGGPSIPSNYLYPLSNCIENRSIIFFDQLGCGDSSIPLDVNA